MGSWFVRPETAILPLSEGRTVTVKRYLTAGEYRARIHRSLTRDAAGVLYSDPLMVTLSLITAYLLDWTVLDDTGAIVPIAGLSTADLDAVLNNLDPERFAEIHNAIETHQTAMRAARDEEKKTAGPTP